MDTVTLSKDTSPRPTKVTAALRSATRLAWMTAGLGLTTALWTFTDSGLLHGPPAMQGSARGTAAVLGAVAVPVLVSSALAARRGSGAALVTWAGALLYVVYNSVLLLFLTPFNAAFLLYVALFGSSLWAVGLLVTTPEIRRFSGLVAQRAPVRAVAVYVWVVAALNAAAWLSIVAPSLREYPTPLLEGTGVQTNAIYVQDLAVWLPLGAVAAVWLWRREARGALVVGAILGLWVIEAVSIAVDQWFGVAADPDSPVVSLAVIPPFVALAAVGLVALWALLRPPAVAAPSEESHRPQQRHRHQRR